MFHQFKKITTLIFIITTLAMIGIHSFGARPAISSTLVFKSPNPPISVATAETEPRLWPAVFGGKPVYVLYMTRANDRVLVRCYPGYVPSIVIKPMANENTSTEGSMTCMAPA